MLTKAGCMMPYLIIEGITCQWTVELVVSNVLLW